MESAREPSALVSASVGLPMKVSEAHIQQAVVNFLEIDGWRPIRMEQNFNQRKMKVVGEKGMPDYLFLRYGFKSVMNMDNPLLRMAEHIWIEFKAPQKKAREEQVRWHTDERLNGALVMVVDDYDFFRDWYVKSGLKRRIK